MSGTIPMQEWKTLSRRTVLTSGKFLTVEYHSLQLPDGQVIPEWPWVITPDFVNILARTEDGKFLCFRQTKYGLDGMSLAPAGGYIEPGEDPLEAAKRELLEETGYEAPDWTDLGTYRVGPNRGIAMGYLFLARNARRVAEPDADDLEEQELLHLSRAEVEEALDSGEFKAMVWAAIVALALRKIHD